MFDKEQFRDEIKAYLKDVPRDKRVAFAVRSAMRVLPLLAVQKKATFISTFFIKQNREAFWFWKAEDKNKHLLAVLNAYSWSIKYAAYASYASSSSNSAYAASISAATYSCISAATNASIVADDTNIAVYTFSSAAAAADAAAYTSSSATTYTTYAADAASVSVYATYTADAAYDVIIQEIQQDLVAIEKLSAQELLQQPLWSAIPEDWQQLLTDFKTDALSLNAGFEVWLDWYDDRLQGKTINIELLKKWDVIPKVLKQQGVAAVNAHLKNLVQKTAMHPLNRVRTIFIGYGEAGKTSLIHALNSTPVVEGDGDMTPGVDICDWPVPNTDIKAYFWDFGGQVMAHATHQFFLRSSCLYVLVLNARSEINGTVQAEYWLEHVKGFGKDAPVMIVGNKADQATINLDMSYLKEKYPNIVDFYSVSCTQASTKFKAKFDSFKQDFCHQLEQLNRYHLFTKEQIGVLQTLSKYAPQEAFLSCQKFIEICAVHGISTEGEKNRDWFLDILDKLGVVIHFPKLAYLDSYVLNPRWLTHGVYKLMYNQQSKLTARNVVAILCDKPISDENGNILKYPPDKCAFLTKAMQEFKLCYPLPTDHNTLIIPELLPTDQPNNIPFEKSGALAFEFAFRGFLPRHMMPELIVNRHEEIIEIEPEKKQIVWQRGVLLQHKIHSAQALLQVDYRAKVLFIWVQGSDAKDYLSLLNDEVLKILGRLDLNYEELIELPFSACTSKDIVVRTPEKAGYRRVLRSVKEGIYLYAGEHNTYDLRKVLGVIIPEAELSKFGPYIYKFTYNDNYMSNNSMKITQNLTNSTVHGSVIAAEKIENCFNSLQESKANDDVKELLVQLLNEIKSLNNKVPEAQAQTLADMTEETETLIGETGRLSPRKKWYEASLSGIKEAALAVGEIAKPVLAIAEKLSPLLLSL